MNIGENCISARTQGTDGMGGADRNGGTLPQCHILKVVFLFVFCFCFQTKDRCPEFSSLTKQMAFWEVQIEDLEHYECFIIGRDNGRLWSI